jgi:RNA polymerase sporulation-specific sigma factor
MQNKVELCGVNTAKLKVLKNEETQALLRRAKAGDRQAREELIAGNLRLVLSVIHKFSNRGENVDDLFQVGCIGLIKAIDNFNTDLDVRFSTYGVPMNVLCRNSKLVPKINMDMVFFNTYFVNKFA